MAPFRLEDVEMDDFPGVQQPFMSLPFFGPEAVTPSTRPCPVCLRGFAWIRWVRKWKLDASANNGCLFCRLVVIVTNFYASGLDYAAGIGIYHETTVIDVVWMHDTRSSSRVSLYDVPDFGPFATLPGFEMPEMPPVQEIIGDTGSDRAMKLAKQWVYNCDAQHTDCKGLSTCPLPKRILDVGQPEPGQGRVLKGRNICLYETKGECVEYVCLSHCWGTAPMFQTTQENIHTRLQSIQFNHLPKTFQDAVEITRELKVRYLWIDSLCIIQKDQRDWIEQGLQMHEIYGNAFLTLAASRCRGPNEGLFSVSADYKLENMVSLLEDREFTMRTRPKIYHFDSPDAFPLLQRGWVFQERILSRRMLHFGPQELLWECMTDELCECGNIKDGIRMDSGVLRKKLFLVQQNVFLWSKIVEGYSSLALTQEKDILPALSGIAQKHKPAPNAEYLAGLWGGKDFDYGLLWYVKSSTPVYPGEDPNNLRCRPSFHRAPSWSWASVKSAVTYEIPSAWASAVEVQAVKVIPAGRNSAGEVIYGELTVTGWVAEVTCHRGAQTRDRWPPSPLELRIDGESLKNVTIYPDYSWARDEKWWIHETQHLLC
ncbi:heterokaryon incompatibility protein-domain-containing protein [Phaeosphaeriaceae sp. PMI808]|nr:heterokaryon incompatibility protein-domain-containing protein [Phaeosphaeriaceae sp. PMI808]